MKKYNAENAASDFLDGLCEPHGWSLADLAKMSGYRLETLQKVRRGHTDTPLTDKMRRHLLNTSNLAAGIAEESPPYRVRLIEPGGPPGGREVSIPATTEAGLIAEGMEIFGDLKIASKTSRRVLLKRLREILDEIEHPKIQTQQQSQ